MNGHRLLNPAATDGSHYRFVPSDKGEAVRVPFLKKPFAIDPESLKVWELDGGSLPPQTDGLQVNFPYFHVERPESVCLSVTRACNLRCPYCYVRNRPDIRGGAMFAETGLKALKLCDPRGTSIGFFGGEPLLQLETIKAVVAQARWMCDNPEFHVTTNGTLLGEESAAFFKQHSFSLLVSLDGPPELHNRNRPLGEDSSNIEQSYSLTLSGLRTLEGHGLSQKVTLRATYTKDCVHIAERLAHLNELCDQGLATQVAVEPVSSSESSCIDPLVGETLGFNESDALGLQAEYERAFEWALSRVKSGKSVRWHQLNLFAHRVLLRSPAPSECGAGKGYIGISPEGHVFACHQETQEPIGHVESGFDERARAPWLENRLFMRKRYPECWCRFICGGGCRADSLVHMGDISTPYRTGCNIVQILAANTIRLLSQLTDEEQALVLYGQDE